MSAAWSVYSGSARARSASPARQALSAAAWCGHAQVTRPDEREGKWELVGDPTEGAVVLAAAQAGDYPAANNPALRTVVAALVREQLKEGREGVQKVSLRASADAMSAPRA